MDTLINSADWWWVIVGIIGTIINGVVTFHSRDDLRMLARKKINGRDQRDAHTAYERDRVFTCVQLVFVIGGLLRTQLEPAPEHWPLLNKMTVSSCVVMIASSALIYVAVRNLWLRRAQMAEVLARHGDTPRTRRTDP